jgi:hypothetical protein
MRSPRWLVGVVPHPTVEHMFHVIAQRLVKSVNHDLADAVPRLGIRLNAACDIVPARLCSRLAARHKSKRQ